MLWDGAGYPRLALHMARLSRSARAFGWRAPQVALPAPEAPARVRLLVGASGEAVAEVFALPDAKAEWVVGVSSVVLQDGPLRRFKTNQRADYEAARAGMTWDEALMVNARGEVCEGTITSVFFDRGQGMRTPPLSCGLLEGVLRAELSVPEEVLRVEDLGRVRLWVGNALRGLIPARLAGQAG
ncbi:aminotransferase class IV [Rhodobacteraceae bacterium CYK-10]|uniref:Probable branched-chain-amino-acid aminotransferase n=2 Tax=Stagnihabitans tardus TaxID=2699202 RepID=A0AAE5BTQ1_9RHOB|nr:aminotransferase class IV [Stagnihabitans tardus]